MAVASPRHLTLRPTIAADVATLFTIQLDPIANARAGTKARDHSAFMARWDQILRDPRAAGVTPRVILADDVLVGSINIVSQDGVDSIGYWIDREHWGRGIATRAIGLMIAEFPARPLTAQVAAHNLGSLRALERNAFVVTSRYNAPETERSVARDMLTLTLP